MLKLLLIQPPIQDFYDTDVRLQPIGLASLKASVLKHLGDKIEVKIIDFHQGWGRKTIAIPRELKYLRDYYPHHDKSPFCLFHAYYHFGADFETLAEKVALEKPNWVGISSLFSPYYREVLQCAQSIKEKIKTTILLGGSHVSACPELMLNNPHVDFILRGEGERPLVEFLKVAMRSEQASSLSQDYGSQVPNLGYKLHGKIILNAMEANYPLSEIPPPDLSDLNPQNYRYEGKAMTMLVSSRSCPHRCSFCSVHQTFGYNYRRNNVKRVMDEIRNRYKQGYRVIDFEDDNLSFYQDEMKELCQDLIREFPKQEMQFVAMNGISYLSLDNEILSLMRKAGFTHLNLALVSSDKTVRETTKRPHTIEKYLEVVHEAFRLGFKIVSYQILGLPNEKLESMLQTLAFAAGLPILLGASPFYLTPNSPISKALRISSNESDVFKARLSAMAIEGEDFSRDELYTLFISTRIFNFIKSWKLDEPEISLAEALESLNLNDIREKNGIKILKELFQNGILLADTPQDFKPLKRFRYEVFARLCELTKTIATLEGKKVLLNEEIWAASKRVMLAS